MSSNLLQELQRAIASGDQIAIRASIPEPPNFLPAVFALPLNEREVIFARVLPVFETDEDRWELIEAAAQRTIAQSTDDAFLMIIPYIPASLLADARTLASTIPNKDIADIALQALHKRADVLGG